MSVENLYLILRGGGATPPNQRFIVKAVMDTEKCQQWHDLKEIRERTAEELRKEMPRAPLDEALCNEEACAEVVMACSVDYQKALLRTLPWRSRSHYYFADHSREIGLATSVMLGCTVGFAFRTSRYVGVIVAGATFLSAQVFC